MGEARGWLKLVEDSETGRLVGAHFWGLRYWKLIGGVTLAIRKGLSAGRYHRDDFSSSHAVRRLERGSAGLC